MNTPLTFAARPAPVRRARALLIAGSVLALGLAALGAGTAYIFQTQPPQVAVTDSAGVARFNFRVGGIPVPGVVPGVRVAAQWNPADLARSSATVSVPLKALNTGITLRDEHALNYLGAHKHPQASFRLERLEGVSKLSAGQQAQATAKGTFNLNGVDHPLEAPIILALDAAGQKLTVTTTFDVAFQDYGISIPGADPRTDITVQFRLPAK